MKSTLKKRIIFFSFIGIILFLNACSNLKKIDFDVPVNTTNKTLNKQVKQIYSLNDLGIYASNDFDGARLNGFQKENDSTAILIINPENVPINNSAYYAFKTWSNTPKTIYYEFRYPRGYRHRYIPKIKINNHWSIIDSTSILKMDSIVTIKLNLTKEPITVAAQEVQSSTDVLNWYSDLVSGKEDIVSIKSAGKSTLGRNLPVLDIGLGDKKEKEIIVLLTRQHPPEVTGYYAYQYFVETLLNGSELSEKFLRNYRVLAFPIMNPDGVDLGHWRHNAGGVDLNRDWSIYNQPEIKQTVKFINKTLKKNNSKLILGLDFHSTWYDIFYTNNERINTSLPQFIDDWFKALENNIPNYKVNEKPGKSTKPVSKGWFLYAHNTTGITYEIGDNTPKDSIKQISKISAEQMMNILLNK
ncbi:MAG: M14 family metallopeptidase [Bacteroidota bacterium]